MILVLSVSLMSAMCSSDDDDLSNNNSVEIAQVENTATTGTWGITNFVDSGQNKTSDFDGYEFTFSSNGSITATNGSMSYEGTWYVGDDSYDDDSSNDDDDLEFNIDFLVSDSNEFAELDDDWDIVSYSDTVINLIDVDLNGVDTDMLTFERN